MDMDNNDYPDLLVGAYDSGNEILSQSSWREIVGGNENNVSWPGHAVYMRSAPVAHMTASVNFDVVSKQIDYPRPWEI